MDAPPTHNPRLNVARRPLGDEVRDALVGEFILSGLVPAGERLPTEAKLSERYGVSRVTVRAALRSLQDAGLITVRQGSGSTVLPQPARIMSGLERLGSFDTFARELGARMESVELESEVLPADEAAAERLQVEPGASLLAIRRVKVHRGARIGWIVDYVPTHVLAPETLLGEYDGSVLDVLLAHTELGVEYSDCEIVPVSLGRPLARRLEVSPGAAALYLDEQTCARDGRVVNWSQAWLLPTHLRFSLRRRRAFQ